MYTPRAFAVAEAAAMRAMIRRTSFGHLITSAPVAMPQLLATPIPFVIDDEPWKLRLVSDLTDHHEQLVAGEASPWQVSDAPDDFIAGQLRAIVGIEMQVTEVEAKQKLSQNKSAADRAGAIEGLIRSDRDRDRATARLMETRRD